MPRSLPEIDNYRTGPVLRCLSLNHTYVLDVQTKNLSQI